MRHRLKKHHLARPADQRKALLRTLSTSLFTYYEIKTTLIRAKALKEQADRIVSFAKRGDLHAIRQVSKLVYDNKLGTTIEDGEGRSIEETILRRIFKKVAPRFAKRQGGYTRVIKLPPRRGDASPMALVQLTFELDIKHVHEHRESCGHDHAEIKDDHVHGESCDHHHAETKDEHEHHHEHGDGCNHDHEHLEEEVEEQAVAQSQTPTDETIEADENISASHDDKI